MPLEPEAELMYIRLDGQISYPNTAPERLQRGLATLNVVIGDLHSDPIQLVQLDPTSTIRNPIFTITDPDSSQSFVSRFRTMMLALPEPEPEVNMQAMGWGIADNDDYATSIIQEWYQLKLEGFPQYPEYVPCDHVWCLSQLRPLTRESVNWDRFLPISGIHVKTLKSCLLLGMFTMYEEWTSFQPAYLQAGSSSNAFNQRSEPSFPRSTPLEVLTVLIDNGSMINVYPLRVSYRQGLAKKDLMPSNLFVKAYDSKHRVVEGTLMLKLDAEGFEMDIEFHVVNRPTIFNLLLSRPWLDP
ncbi:hypothetical protein RHMOL_Rhmol01G0147300 [Rhododendron molle]|uniref:Uncharacterized protein n=1 Tax=Rhododendron molle TaxID=49168 RepID=A0ACC0Q321_RHOML|nr:hypothetical protein RHMOL_Rhmol01G0147300 [Rhododendron molle]